MGIKDLADKFFIVLEGRGVLCAGIIGIGLRRLRFGRVWG